jgi:hypothetical protein
MHSSDKPLRAATEPKIVMADSHTSRNVESPLVRSVVDLSTTGVDATKSQDTPAAPGDSTTKTTTTTPAAAADTLTTTSALNTKTEPGTPSEVGVRMPGVEKDQALMYGCSQTGTTPVDVGSDIDRSGTASPSKTDRKAPSKKPSFKPVSVNKQFLKDTPAATPPPASPLISTLQPKGAGFWRAFKRRIS